MKGPVRMSRSPHLWSGPGGLWLDRRGPGGGRSDGVDTLGCRRGMGCGGPPGDRRWSSYKKLPVGSGPVAETEGVSRGDGTGVHEGWRAGSGVPYLYDSADGKGRPPGLTVPPSVPRDP